MTSDTFVATTLHPAFSDSMQYGALPPIVNAFEEATASSVEEDAIALPVETTAEPSLAQPLGSDSPSDINSDINLEKSGDFYPEAELDPDIEAVTASSSDLDADFEAAGLETTERLAGDEDEPDQEDDLETPRRAGNPNLQVRFKSERGRLLLLLPPDPEKSRNPVDWEDLRQQLRQRLSAGERFLQPNTIVHLVARDRLLDSRQIQEIDELLNSAQLRIKRIYTRRRQTAVAAVTAGYSVEQQTTLTHLKDKDNQNQAIEEPLYLQSTLRSGVEVRHPGTIIILGDVNPGSSIVAEGDIFVWGRLRGVAHAGAAGNEACRIMALYMQPTQLRIADTVARAPAKPPELYQPEVAYIGAGGIRIAIASEFSQVYLNAPAT